MLFVLVWACLAMQAGGLVLRDHSKNKTLHTVRQQEASQANASSDKRMHDCLKGKRIVFIGPSTSKADYLTLAFFAEYGRWPSEEQVFFGNGEWGPNPINEGGIPHSPLPVATTSPVYKDGCIQGGQNEHVFRYTNYLFNGHEACDCFEFGGWAGPVDVNNATENRIYLNGDTMISYFQWFGDVVPPRGTYDLTPLLSQPPQPPTLQCPVGQFSGEWTWAYSMRDFLLNVVRQARPTHLVLSTSFWPIQPLMLDLWDDIADAGVQAVMDTGGAVIWRTTPQRTDHTSGHVSPRVNMTPFVDRGWQLFPAQTIVAQYQGWQNNNAVFYDFAHLRPPAQCHLTKTFLQTHVCPGMV